ncbi:hypothetical protein PanWU01x14_105710, partial [Parasponia andersonii]
MSSFQTFSSPPFKSLTTSHKQLLHLKPAPKLIMNTRSPFFSLFFASMYPSTYHRLPADVFPNRCSVILAGSRSYGLRSRFTPMPSITAFPPVWMQKWSTPVRKSITGGFADADAAASGDSETPFLGFFEVVVFQYIQTAMNRRSSRIGNIFGAMTLRLSTKARVAALGRFFSRWKPSLPWSSSFCKQHPYESSRAPWCVRTRHLSLNMALSFRARLLVRRMAQPPDLKRQLERIMDLSFPEYQLGLSDSEVTTTAS